jgi:ABC-type transport system involved in multi-copper enzyme maturation permease subunit
MEWTKMCTLRSTTWTLAAMATVTVGTAVLVAATTSLQPDDTILGGSLGNAAVGQIAAGIFGVLVVCGEYSSGTIRATLSACPRRLIVLTAKALVVATVVLVVAFASAMAAHQVGIAMLSGQGYPPGRPMPALLGVAFSYAAVAVLGVAVGTALRHTAGAITAITAIILLPILVGPLMGSWQRWIAGASPIAALQKLAQTSDAVPESLGSLDAWPSLWLVCGYSIAALAVSGWLLRRRDT